MDKEQLLKELYSKLNITQKVEEKKEKASLKVLDLCIIFVFTFITLYTGIVLVMYFQIGSEPSALTAGVFGIFSGELLMCMLLQRTKIKLGKKDKDDDDNNNNDDDNDDMNNIIVG